MNLLSKVSLFKIYYIGTICEIRSTLNVLGLMSNKRTEEENKKDCFKIPNLARNLNSNDFARLVRYTKQLSSKD